MSAAYRSHFATLDSLPPDALLKTMQAFRADTRSDKIDLGVGVYQDDNGATPIIRAVRAAEQMRLTSQITKSYESQSGNDEYREALKAFVFGSKLQSQAVDVFATPGGCGAVSICFKLLKALASVRRVWISDPTWPNYLHVARVESVDFETYPYQLDGTGRLDFEKIKETLQKADTGDAVIIQGPCHNPTGIDLSAKNWSELAELCLTKNLLPIVDIAYHGFSDDVDIELAAIKSFVLELPNTLLCYSCSKNFGLYRERTGALMIVSNETAETAAVASQIAALARSNYSMPPAHGSFIVQAILNDSGLKSMWLDELTEMRERMNSLRRELALAIKAQGHEAKADAIIQQHGMFTLLNLPQESVDALQAEKAIYLAIGGRVNIAGLKRDKMAFVASSLAPYL